MPDISLMMNGPHDNTSDADWQRLREWTAKLSSAQWLVLGVALASLLLGGLGEPARTWLRYDREAIVQGHEYWRLFTGHLVHIDARHLLLNVAGLGLIAALCRGCYTFRQWLWLVLLVVLTIDAGFLTLMPELTWYVGLSGALHGVLAAGAVRWWRVESPWLAAALTAILVGKLTWEQWQGALPLAGDISVVVNAHLYGALGGAIGALWLDWRRRRLSGLRTVT